MRKEEGPPKHDSFNLRGTANEQRECANHQSLGDSQSSTKEPGTLKGGSYDKRRGGMRYTKKNLIRE